MTINNIDDLTRIILSNQFSDSQIKLIIEKALNVLIINDIPDRKKLSEMVQDFFDKYGSQMEHPIFFELDIDIE